MSRALLIMSSHAEREKAKRWIDKIPLNSRIEFKRPQRSIDQNSKMWACLTDISEQVRWHGLRLSPEDFKILFLDSLRREARMVPNLDENGFVSLGRSSSDLSKEEMSDLIELILEFGARHDVKFHEPGSPLLPGPAAAPEAAQGDGGLSSSSPPSPASYTAMKGR